MIERIKALVGVQSVRLDEPMSRHTTFRIGGPVRAMIFPRSTEQLQQLVRLFSECKTPLLVLGNGSNLLVADEGIDGYVVKIEEHFSDFVVENNRVTAGAGILLSALAVAAMDAELGGLEFASGIPGTLGGAVFMNAGAYGGEIKDVVRWVEVIDRGGERLIVDRSALDFGYRTSAVREHGWIVTRVGLELQHGNYEEIKALTDDLTRQRAARQPLELPSAGSMFKRPQGHFAGSLIEQAGLRGLRVGDAQVSEKHCGFIVNTGSATCADVLALVERVRSEVYKQSGVMLEREVRVFGRE